MVGELSFLELLSDRGGSKFAKVAVGAPEIGFGRRCGETNSSPGLIDYPWLRSVLSLLMYDLNSSRQISSANTGPHPISKSRQFPHAVQLKTLHLLPHLSQLTPSISVPPISYAELSPDSSPRVADPDQG